MFYVLIAWKINFQDQIHVRLALSVMVTDLLHYIVLLEVWIDMSKCIIISPSPSPQQPLILLL